jgi:hypothetical protein
MTERCDYRADKPSGADSRPLSKSAACSQRETGLGSSRPGAPFRHVP